MVLKDRKTGDVYELNIVNVVVECDIIYVSILYHLYRICKAEQFAGIYSPLPPIESLYIFPFALVVFYLISKNGLNDFNLENPGLSVYLLLAGPMTVIPLFLYVRGVELIGLGPTGMIFYITPSLQFILGYFYYDEDFSLVKFISFIIIWIAVIIYINDLYEKN